MNNNEASGGVVSATAPSHISTLLLLVAPEEHKNQPLLIVTKEVRRTVTKDSPWASSPDTGSGSRQGPALRKATRGDEPLPPPANIFQLLY